MDAKTEALIAYCKARSRCDYYWERGQSSGYAYRENGQGGTSMLSRAREEMQKCIAELNRLQIPYQNRAGEHLPEVRAILDRCSAGNYYPEAA